MKKEIKKDIPRELFEMVYQWGRVGIIVDENSPAFKETIKDLLEVHNKELREKIEGILIPHGFVSDDPKIERIVQDEKLKALEDINKLLK